MKWLSKLSVLLRSLARGPQTTTQRRAETPSVDPVRKESAIEPQHDLERERVADLLQRRLTSSELDSQPGEKGD